MNKRQYYALRDQAYKLVGVVGTEAETADSSELSDGYRRGSEMLDAIDALGYRLGYLNPETNAETETPANETAPDSSDELTKDEMIDCLVDAVDGWDLESLTEWAKDVRRQILEDQSLAQVSQIYQNELGEG